MTEEGDEDAARQRSHLGLRLAPQTEQTHSRRRASTQDEYSRLLCDCYSDPTEWSSVSFLPCSATAAGHIYDSEHT